MIRSKLTRAIDKLRAEYGKLKPPPAKTAFELILWEKVAYLATDERRAKAFAALRERVGLTPQTILGADPEVLREIAAMGGAMAAGDRARHMQDAAALVLDEFNGSLDDALALPLPKAKRALQRFHGVGEPGAEKILLLMRKQCVLPLDSNALRTLVRLGYGAESKKYAAMYRGTSEAARPELRDDVDWLIDAHLLLRRHGQEVCKTSSPHCEACVLRDGCPSADF